MLEFWEKAFEFHKQMYDGLSDRKWDVCDFAAMKEKIEGAFILCYGEDFMEKNRDLDKQCQKIRRKFTEISVKENNCYKYRLSFTFNHSLGDSEPAWKSPLFWVQKESKEVIIDKDCREYESFTDFIINNKYKKCIMTYPANGRYQLDNYYRVSSSFSKACSLKSVSKRVLDVISTIGMTVTTGLLFTNPAGLALGLTQLGLGLTGGYSIIRGVGNVKDIVKHGDGLISKDALIAGGDIILTAGGLLTAGGCTVLKAWVNLSGKVITESSELYKVIKVLGNASKCIFVTVCIVNCVEKFKDGILDVHDLKFLKLQLLIFCNCLADVTVIQEVIQAIAASPTTIWHAFNKVYSCLKICKKFVNSCSLMDHLFPPKVVQISNELTSIDTSISNLVFMFKSGKIDPKLFLDLCCNLKDIYNDLRHNIVVIHDELSKLFSSEVWKKIFKCFSENSVSYEETVKIADEITSLGNKVSEKLQICNKSKINNNQNKSLSVLLQLICDLIKEQGTDNDFDTLHKLKSYVIIFEEEFLEVVEVTARKKFLQDSDDVLKKGLTLPQCTTEMGNELVYDECFIKVLKNLKEKNLKGFPLDKPVKKNPECSTYRFSVDCYSHDFLKFETYYKIANDIGSKFDSSDLARQKIYNDENTTVVILVGNNSSVVFYSEYHNSCLSGIMIHVPLEC